MKSPYLPLLLFVFLGLWPRDAQAVFSLRVGDPRFSWSTQQGTITEATLSVRPRGAYFEYGLYLTFSAQGTTYQPTDSLEVTLKFDLPPSAIVHDSWLWVGNDIVRARIQDRWTAYGIYEGIVMRRQDPSLLAKHSATQYELRVFPMAGNQTRKVKITYLMPAQWGKNDVWAALPWDLIKTSKIVLPSVKIRVFDDFGWPAPSLAEFPDVPFEQAIDPVEGAFHQIILNATYYNAGARLRFPSPLSATGYYARQLSVGDDNFYELMFLPSHFLPPPGPRKLAVLIDAQTQMSTTTFADLLSATKNALAAQLTAQDSFTIFYQKNSVLAPVAQAGTGWLPADPLTLDLTLAGVLSEIVFSTDVAPLLGAAVSFIEATGHNSSILILASSGNYWNITGSNLLINSYMSSIDPVPPVHVVDFRTANAPSFLVNGKSYSGTEYLFSTLAQLSGGSYQTTRPATPLVTVFDNALENLDPLLTGIDFYTTLADGFCYGRLYPAGEPLGQRTNKPIVQIGKFQGAMPLKIEINGEINDGIISLEVEIPAADIPTGDSLISEMWHGNYIRLLESLPQNAGLIGENINICLENRLLSLYTAFLCLEDTSQICEECTDESMLVNINQPAIDSFFRVWPNPFVTQTTFSGRAAQLAPGQEVTVEVYSLEGRLQARLATTVAPNGDWTITWNAGTTCPPGLYLATVHSGRQSRTVKLIKQNVP